MTRARIENHPSVSEMTYLRPAEYEKLGQCGQWKSGVYGFVRQHNQIWPRWDLAKQSLIFIGEMGKF